MLKPLEVVRFRSTDWIKHAINRKLITRSAFDSTHEMTHCMTLPKPGEMRVTFAKESRRPELRVEFFNVNVQEPKPKQKPVMSLASWNSKSFRLRRFYVKKMFKSAVPEWANRLLEKEILNGKNY